MTCSILYSFTNNTWRRLKTSFGWAKNALHSTVIKHHIPESLQSLIIQRPYFLYLHSWTSYVHGKKIMQIIAVNKTSIVRKIHNSQIIISRKYNFQNFSFAQSITVRGNTSCLNYLNCLLRINLTPTFYQGRNPYERI